jgi:hypothetical protein
MTGGGDEDDDGTREQSALLYRPRTALLPGRGSWQVRWNFLNIV